MTTRWEYRIIPLQSFEDFAAVEATLDGFGAEGWEVFAIEPSGNSVRACMKRQSEAAVGAPINLTAPSLNKATAVIGDDITCSPGTWEGGTVEMAFQWQRNGNNIPDATSYTFRAKSADVGNSLVCAVTAANDAGHTTAISGVCTVAAAA